MELHIPTIFAVLIICCITLAISALIASERHAGDGLREWGVTLCILAMGYILLSLRGLIPNFLSIVCANTLLSSSFSMLYYAVHKFLGIHSRPRCLLCGPPLAAFCGMLLFPNSIVIRVLIINIILIFQGIMIQRLLLKHKFTFPVNGRNLIVSGILFSIIGLAWKLYVAIADPYQVKNIFLTFPSQVALYLFSFISLIMISNGFALMAKERSDASLRKSAMLDKLTGCWNRVRIEEILQQEMARQRRYGHPAAMLMLDLDNFKNVNDQFGHLAGDEVLRSFGQLLRTNISATDVPGRWGGEEFIVVLPASTFFDAAALAEKIRDQLENLSFSFMKGITVSIGVAACRATDSVEEWIKRADLALYKAKISGRNQVKVEDLEGSFCNFMCRASRALRLQWDPVFECGYAEIDQQHRNLFEIVNTLLQMEDRGADKAELAEGIQLLFTETIAHFQFEERILEQTKHKELAHHARAHQRLLDRANTLLTQFQRDELDLTALLNFMIYELTAQHIMIDDRSFGKIPSVSANHKQG